MLRDVAMEAIVQNTAYVAEVQNAFKSNVDLHQSKYKILTGGSNEELLNPPRVPYPKDKKAYYPCVDPAKAVDNKESFYVPKFNPRSLYEKDKIAYYNPTGVFKVLPLPHPQIGTEVPIVLADLQDKFPSEQNLKSLQNQLEAIKTRDDIASNINEISEKGIYMGDPKPYYDPTVDDTKENVGHITGSIINMEKSLNNAIRNEITANLGTVKVHREIQHIENYHSEALDAKMKENYYTPVGKDSKGNNVEMPPKSVEFKNTQTPPTTYGPRVEVDVEEHKTEEAVEVPGKLPNKYVSREKTDKNLRSNKKTQKQVKKNKNEAFKAVDNKTSLAAQGFARNVVPKPLDDAQKLDKNFHEIVKKYKEQLVKDKAVK